MRDKKKPGPKPIPPVVIDAADWEDAVRVAITVKKPDEGWPERDKKSRKKRGKRRKG